MSNGDEYERSVLNGRGCVYGRNLAMRFETWEQHYKERMDKVESKLDRLTWAAVGLTISLMTASLTLWITYLGS